MTRNAASRTEAQGFLRREQGGTTVEFAIALPMLLFIFVMAIDLGIAQLRQVFLDRAVDLAVRDVRLGRLPQDGSTQMSTLICEKASFLPNCLNRITVEMQPINTESFDGLTDPFRCIDRELELNPALTFNPGSGGQAQELMMIRACVIADPFITFTGYVSALPRNAEGRHVLVSRNVFVNEPRSADGGGQS